MMREFTCIICPNGCEIRAEIEEKEGGAVEILSVEGAACKKGNAYVIKVIQSFLLACAMSMARS